MLVKACRDEHYLKQIKDDLQKIKQSATLKRRADLDAIIALFAGFLQPVRQGQ
jgi:hypothetical protein